MTWFCSNSSQEKCLKMLFSPWSLYRMVVVWLQPFHSIKLSKVFPLHALRLCFKILSSNYIFLLGIKMTRREDIMVMKQGKERVSVREHCWLAEITEQNHGCQCSWTFILLLQYQLLTKSLVWESWSIVPFSSALEQKLLQQVWMHADNASEHLVGKGTV